MSGPRRQDPFSELFGEFTDRLGGERWHPRADVFETEKSFILRMEMAGVTAGDLKVSVDGEVLTVRGVRRAPVDTEVHRLHRMEIAFGPFERSVRISAPFEADGVSAHLEDGFLCVKVPKKGASRRRIEVEGGRDT